MKPKNIDFKKFLVWVVAPGFFWGIIIALCITCCSCLDGSTQEPQTKTPSFRLPDIPVNIIKPELRAEYLSVHYWDNYDFTDATHVASPEKTEQILSDYIAILPYVSDQMIQISLLGLLSGAEKNEKMLLFFTELLQKYLYDPNSPFRNEEYYLHVLRFIEASPLLDEVHKSRFAYQLKSVLKNRKGTMANDFTYTFANGTEKQMHSIKAEFLLLYFNNPGCHACKEVQAQLESSPVVSAAIKKRQLKILAIYPDENLVDWKAHMSQIPTAWDNGYDAGLSIRGSGIYDLRAIPSLYLLDKNKVVLLKDGAVMQVEQWLSSI